MSSAAVSISCESRRDHWTPEMWEFKTEPEFEEHLAWMREFMREEIWPLEVVLSDFDEQGFFGLIAPLQAKVKERGLWATHLPPELGGQGFGQVKLGLMH